MPGDIDKYFERLKKLESYFGEDRIVSFQEAQEYHNRRDGKKKTIYCGFSKLNKLTGGFLCGQLIVISGPTGEGKTTVCQTLTNQFAMVDINCCWFSYELTPQEFLSKFPEIPRAYMPLDKMEDSLVWLEDRIEESIIKYKVKIIFIDHLHYLISLSKRANTSLIIGDIMRKLKLMTLKHNIIIFIIAHLQKISLDNTPELNDIRDSSFIGQEADKVMMIWRKVEKRDGEKVYVNKATLYLAKDRQTGRKGNIPLFLEDNLFYEEDKK